MAPLRNHVGPQKFTFARELRRTPTPAEALLWSRLRNRQLNGAKFRRQSVLLGWIVDFYCPEHRLVVEVDGDAHRSPLRMVVDTRRDDSLKAAGMAVLRVTNTDVQTQIDRVLQDIARMV